jgi:hypothetical protein
MDSNRGKVLDITKLSRRHQDPSYDACAVRPSQDVVLFGNYTPERVAKIKQAYPNMSEAQITHILNLGAASHNNFDPTKRISQSEKDALKTVAARHTIKYNPDLNAYNTAQTYIQNRLKTAQSIPNPITRQNAFKKWGNMIVEYKDLDGKPETLENLVLRQRDDPNDLHAVDGLTFVSRTGRTIQGGIRKQFPTKESRRITVNS